MRKLIRVLIIDDSASVRQALAAILSEDPDFELLEPASDPFVAAKRLQTQVPDVITLDVEMPRMDGLTFLRKLMAQRPILVVMCSSLTEDGSETLLQAPEAGAADVILNQSWPSSTRSWRPDCVFATSCVLPRAPARSARWQEGGSRKTLGRCKPRMGTPCCAGAC